MSGFNNIQLALGSGLVLEAFVVSSETTPANRIISSDDGTTGTTRLTGSTTRGWPSIAFSPVLGTGLGRLVMVSETGIANAVAYSDDLGVTWTFVPSADDTKIWTTVRWLPDLALFVAGANSAGSNNCMTSPDGINWTSRNPGANVRVHAITSDGAGTALIAGVTGANPQNVLTTTNFTAFAGPFLNQNNRTVALSNFLNGFFYSFGTQGDVWRSPDGVTWTSRGTIGVGSNIAGTCGCWQNENGVILVCSNANGLWSSTNGGTNWTQRIALPTPDVRWAPGRGLFLASQSNTNNFRTSSDGVTWATINVGTSQLWNGVTSIP